MTMMGEPNAAHTCETEERDEEMRHGYERSQGEKETVKSYEELVRYLADYKTRIDRVRDAGLAYYADYQNVYQGKCAAVAEMYGKTTYDVALDVMSAIGRGI